VLRGRGRSASHPIPEKERMFFFEKKNQKTFAFLARADRTPATANKSFLLLFFKKEVLPFL
jgi:hypothetical protein